MERVIIITGANSGIGKAAVEKFAKEGNTVILACRNLVKSKPVVEQLQALYPQARLVLLHLDLSSFSSVKQFAQNFQAQFDRLDVLIHNAAYLKHGEREYHVNEDGIELAFATNVIGPYLLSQLLLSSLQCAENPVILHACTTNIKHFFNPKRSIDFESIHDMQLEKVSFSSYKQYGDSKMALWLQSQKLAEQCSNLHIRVNTLQINRVQLSPDTIAQLSPTYRILSKLQNKISQPPEQMAQLYFDICTSQRYSQENGKLINHHGQTMLPAKHDIPTPFQLISYLNKNDYYPSYGANEEHMNKIWNICRKATLSYF